MTYALKKASIIHTKYNDVLQCPYKIIYRGHYELNGKCRCHDQHHRFMIEWGYEWNKDKLMWKPKE